MMNDSPPKLLYNWKSLPSINYPRLNESKFSEVL